MGAGRRALLGLRRRDGWWNLYRDGEQLTALEAELGYPQWVFGLQHVRLPRGRADRVHLVEHGLHSFAVLDPGTGELERLDLPFTASMPYVTRARKPVRDPRRDRRPSRSAITSSTPTSGTYETVVRQNDAADRPGVDLGGPRDRVRESHGRTAHAFYYPPTNAEFEAPDGEKPPLRVVIHGGPTSQAKLAFHLFDSVLHLARLGASST